MGRINIIVLDSFGVGELPDANMYGDEGSNTLEGIYNNTSLNLPNLKKIGLYNINGLHINEKEDEPIALEKQEAKIEDDFFDLVDSMYKERNDE